MEHINYAEFIERYLDGEMQGAELLWFEKELEGDGGLQKELRLRKGINEAIVQTDVLVLREELNTMHEELFPEKAPAKTFRVARQLTMAVSIALLLTLGIGLFFSTGSSKEALFDKYYQPYEATMTYRSLDEMSPALRDALVNYEAGNFAEASVLFEKVLAVNHNDMESNLLLGISQMETAKYNEAGKSFDKIILHNDNLFIEQAQWYLGFCYLMTENTGKAMEQFKQIAESRGHYAEKAEKIVKKLE